MASQLNPYLNFSGNAREAMEFYQQVFGGELTLTTFGEFGQQGTPIEHLIMHASLQTPAGYTLMASDPPPGMAQGDANGNLSLSGDDEAELRGYWERLVVGGTITLPLQKQMWGDVYGQCTDRFGVNWMVNIAIPNA